MNKNESSQSGQGCQRLVTFCDLFSGGGFRVQPAQRDFNMKNLLNTENQ